MKLLLLISLMLTGTSSLGAHKVWQNTDGDYFDPANLGHRQVSYFELPLLREDGRYRVRSIYTNGQLRLEGFTQEPEWHDRSLIGSYREWHPNGQLKSTGHYIPRPQPCRCSGQSTVKNGAFTDYHSNGQLKRAAEYKAGVLIDGEYEEYDETGQVELRYRIFNGSREGRYQEYFEGIMVADSHYRDGHRHGLDVKFSNTGVRQRVHTYDDGYRVGLQQNFYPNGQLEHSYYIRDRQRSLGGEELKFREDGTLHTRQLHELNDDNRSVAGLTEEFYPDEQLKERWQSKEGHRIREQYSSDGTLTFRSEVNARNQQVGIWVKPLAHGSRQAHQISRYQNDKLHGLQEVIDQDGTRIGFANYRNGQLHGEVNRVVYGRREIATYINDALHGDYQLLSLKDQKLHIGSYIHGEPDGVHYQFTENGQMLTKKSWREGVPHGEWIEKTRTFGDPATKITTYDNGHILAEKLSGSSGDPRP